ncbi:MAG: penicillin-binding protein 2 [Armatimonadetes bacterium]|nr:penicillin-binding protein 2 [Armatimonadota bacterium]
MSQRSAEHKRYALVGIGMAVTFVVAGYSQAKVQVFDRKKVLAEADKLAHFDLEMEVPARRGAITSSDGRILAQSEDSYELGVNYDKIPRSPAFFVSLASATGIPATELSNPPSDVKGRVWKAPLSADQARRVRQVRREWDADGVSLVRNLRRDYPLSDVTSGVVGAFREGKPITGLEKSQNELLEGTSGEYRGFVDRSGTFVPDKDHPYKDKKNGANIVLTIDAGLQTAAVQALRTGVESNKAKSGCAVVIDPKTGDIMAMASWPTYDPTASWNPGDDFDMAYMGAYEPGSTFKILTLAEGLDSGAVKLGDHTQCVGQIQVGNRVIHCASHGGHSAHGDVDLERAIGKSCNVAAAIWAMKIGRQPMIGFMDKLGLFEKTDVGLPSERMGTFNRKEVAEKLQLATVGFGQSMACVPVNLAAAYAMLANDGKMMKPRLVKSIDGAPTPVKERGQMVKPEVAQEVMKMMESVIQSDFGTGKGLKIPGYRLAGKTGTAQKVGSSTGNYVANFVGMVPAQNPRAVVLVMIDTPSAGQYYGGVVAGPVFVDIAKSVIRRFGIPPTDSARR